MIRRLALSFAWGVVLWLIFLVGRSAHYNQELAHEEAQLRASVQSAQLERDLAELRVQFYQSDTFRDRAARSNLCLQLPGESVIIIQKGE